MKPVARLLLCAGVSFREFQEISKLAFAETALSDYGLRGRRTNVSRVAVMTGISRKEVSRLKRNLQPLDEADVVPMSRASLVLAGWFTDTDFSDGQGTPRPLPLEGPERSFSELVGRYAGDVPAGAVKAELKRSGCIEEREDGQIHAMRREFVPDEPMDRLAGSMEVMLQGLASTIGHNSNPDRTGDTHMEEFVFSDTLPTTARDEFRLVARERVQALLEGLEDWLALHDLRAQEGALGGSTGQRVGLGVFYYEEPRGKA